MNQDGMDMALRSLRTDWKALQVAWKTTRETWRDDVAAEFEEKYLLPLELKMRQTMETIHRTAEVVSNAKRECGQASPE